MKTMMFKPVVFEDDAAPDAYLYFCDNFHKQFEMSFDEFMKKAQKVELDMGYYIEWRYKHIMVTESADHPYKTAYKMQYKDITASNYIVSIVLSKGMLNPHIGITTGTMFGVGVEDAMNKAKELFESKNKYSLNFITCNAVFGDMIYDISLSNALDLLISKLDKL